MITTSNKNVQTNKELGNYSEIAYISIVYLIILFVENIVSQ